MTRIAGTALLVASAVVVLLCGCSSPLPSPNAGVGGPIQVEPKICGEVEPPAHGAYIGLFRPPAPFEIDAVDEYVEKTSPKTPAILMWYQPWGSAGRHEFDQAAVVSTYQRGAIPMITWEPWDPGENSNFVRDPANSPDWRLKNILDGKYDDYIKRWAQTAKEVRGPVMVRLMHEMNGQWYPWAGTSNGNTPEDFVKTWRYIHGLFYREGATNVTWVWSINWESIPNTPENTFSAFYPGDAYVDWVGISGFNWGTSNPDEARWRSFDEIYAAPLAYLRTTGKPIVIAEFGSVEDGGDKAAWITDSYTRIRTEHPEVSAVIYYDSREEGPSTTQDWRIDTTDASVEAYREALGDPYYLAAPSTTLSTWLGGLSEQNWMYLRMRPAVY